MPVSLLLIEPVWNRNVNAYSIRFRVRRAFNRTSLESKPFLRRPAVQNQKSFNRTSLESKPDFS